jgi:hypothetical protein
MTRRKTDTIASLPSEVTNVRHWRTREDPFSTVLGTGAAANRREPWSGSQDII